MSLNVVNRSYILTNIKSVWIIRLLSLIALADTFGGAVQGLCPISLVLRTGFIAFLLAYALGQSAMRSNIRQLLLVVIGYFIIKIVINYFSSLSAQVFFVEGGATLKLMYFPLLYAFLLDQLERGKIRHDHLRHLLLVYGWLVLASLLIGHVSGLGGVIEGRGEEIKAGKGFMIGANEVGLMLLLTAPIVSADMMVRMRNVLVGSFTQLFVYGLAGIFVFTKSSLVAIFVTAYAAYRSLRSSGKKTKILLWVGMLGICSYGALQIYKNIDVIEAFLLKTFFSALFDDGVIDFLFRGRQDYIAAIYPQLLDHKMNWFFLLFGAGEFSMRALSEAPLVLMPGEGTTFEMDFFDMFGAYGLVGFVLYSFLVVSLLKQAGPRKAPTVVSLTIFCIMVHSFIAGHVLFSPQVTTLLALVLLYYRSHGKLMVNRTRRL